MNPTKVAPRSRPPPPSRLPGNNGKPRSEVEEHIHDVIDEFEQGVGRKATQAEIASIISSVTDHSRSSSSTEIKRDDPYDSDDSDDSDDDPYNHDHNRIARRLSSSISSFRSSSFAEDELATAQAQFNLLSKQLSQAADIHGDTNEDGYGTSLASKAMAQFRADKFVHEAKEGLDDNYLASNWLMPSPAKAFQHRRYAMFAAGHAPLWSTGDHDLAQFGVGVNLYLRLLKALMVCFSIMTFLSIPSFVFSSAGSKIPLEDRDPLGFSLLSIGNIGDSAVSAVANQVIVNGTMTGVNDDTNIPSSILSPMSQINAADASLLIVFCDFLCCMVFVGLIIWLKRQIAFTENGEGKETLSASDYTLYVRGLPADATKQEITAHFSRLYALDRADWNFPGYCCCCHVWSKKSRLPEDITDRGSLMYDADGNEVMLVQTITYGTTLNIDNTRDDLYLGTWIAECTVIHPNSDLIQEYQKEKLTRIKLKSARAHVKRYASGTPHKDGPNPKKEEFWLQKVEEYTSHQVHHSHSIKRHQSVVDRKNKACSGAFVTFQHEESFLRALSDYRRSTRCLGRCLQPNVLRFRPKRGTEEPDKHKVPLIVVQADEPTNIIWEHLNTTKQEINTRRCCTILPCLLLLIIAMLVVFYVQQQARLFKESTPSIAACSLDIPATYMDSYEAVTIAASSGTGAGLIPFMNRSLAKSMCPEPEKQVYISYANTTLNASGWTLPRILDYEKGLRDINYTASVHSHASCVKPCVDPYDATTCQTRACEENSDGNLCRTFTKNSIVGCYCKGTLERGIAELGYNEEMLTAFRQETGSTCESWLASYIANIGANVGMTVLIVVVNGVLRVLLTLLARSEHHHSEGAESSAISMKVFTATFMNTALTMLIVNSALQNVLPPFLTSMGIGNGEFVDFTTGWYARVGSAFCLTMLLNTITPNLLTWLRLCCLDECNRAKMRLTAVTQRQLNIAYSGAVFKLEYRYPTLLNVIFVTFLYSSGMPVLYPIAACTCGIMYWTDKIALLRLYNRPPMYKAALARLTLRILPLAMVFHCCFAVWMYGSDTLASHSVSQLANTTYWSSSDGLLDVNTSHILTLGEQFNLFERIEKINALIPFLLLIFLVTWYALKLLVWWWVVWLTRCLLKVISCGNCGGGASVFPERKFLPGYTEEHVMYINNQDNSHLTQVENEQGWVCKQNDDGITVRYKVWMKDGVMSQLRHVKGHKKTTWEVIRDTALHTYNIKENPVYADAFSGVDRRSSAGASAGAAFGAGGV